MWKTDQFYLNSVSNQKSTFLGWGTVTSLVTTSNHEEWEQQN